MNRRTFLQLATCLPALAPRAGAALALSQLTSSTASVAGVSMEESLETIRRLGFRGVEILTFAGEKHSLGAIPGVEVKLLTPAEKKRLRNSVRRFEHITTHLPFHRLRPGAPDRAVRQATLDRLHRGIEDSAYWGATIAVLHAASEPNLRYDDIRPALLDAFRELGDHAAKYKMRLGIETGYPNTVADYLGMIREINHEYVGGTVDTGHTRSYRADIGVSDAERATAKAAQRYNDVLMEKVEGLKDKLFHFHVDDVRPADWREHRTLGVGLVDWKRLLGHLNQTGYRGLFAIELEERPPVEQLEISRAFFASLLVTR